MYKIVFQNKECGKMNASHYNELIYKTGEKLDDRYHNLFNSRIKKATEMLTGFEGTLLDIACGDATISLQLKNTLNCEVKAVEMIAENISKAREKGIDAKKVDLNKEKLPFQKNSFEGVFAGEILEHVIDSEGLLLEINRVLKKNGTLLITVPNIANWYNRLIMLFGYLPHYVESGSREAYGTPFGCINGHVKAFTKNSLIQMLEKHGFEIKEVKGSGFSRTKMHSQDKKKLRLGARLFFIAEKILSKKSSFATNLIIKASKRE